MSDPYRPISCADHSELELAVMRRQPLRLRWRDGDAEREAVALPTDVTTEAGAEYLHARTEAGDPLKIRLDALLSHHPDSPSKVGDGDASRQY